MGCIIPTTINICDILEKVKLWTIKRSVLPGFTEESVMNSWNTEDFYDNETIISDNSDGGCVLLHTCQNPQDICNTKREF